MAARARKPFTHPCCPHVDIASVSPALERYRRRVQGGPVEASTALRPRARGIVTIAALIARNQAAEQARYLALALDNGVRPGGSSGIITHLAFAAPDKEPAVLSASAARNHKVFEAAQRCCPLRLPARPRAPTVRLANVGSSARGAASCERALAGRRSHGNAPHPGWSQGTASTALD